MHLRESGRHVVIHTPAKLNLFFEVLGRRSDGFHEVETLVYPINVCDTLIIGRRSDDRVEFRLTQVGCATADDRKSLGDVPRDSSNLVVRAFNLLRQAGGVSEGADLHLVKRIPSEAGLGGGSSDAAALLAGANRLWRLNWSVRQLVEMGAGLGSDIPLFFHNGASVCRGRGEIIEPFSRSPLLHFVLLRPPFGLRTADVYQACEVAEPAHPLSPFLNAFASGHLGRIGSLLFNRLESAASILSPWIARTRRAFDDADCVGHQMTGSGTCYFGLCRHARHARRVARRMNTLGLGKAYAVRGSC